jgi:drug/metabolite transporter (DMT)-like permease
MDGKRRNLIQLNVAVALWGITALFASKKMIDLPVSTLTLGRCVVAAVALLAYILIARQGLAVRSRRDLIILLTYGVLIAVHWVTYFQSIRVSTVAVAIIALHTYPIMTILLEPLLFRERLHLTDVLMGVVVLVGILVLVPHFDLTDKATQGVLWGLVSAAFFTARNLLARGSIRTYSGSTIMFYQVVVTAAVLLPFAPLTGGPKPGNAALQLLLLGVVFTALPHTLFTASFANLKVKTVSIIATLLPIYGALFAWLWLSEVPSWRTVIGGAIVLAAVAFETVRSAGGK